jgi:hypothetical protein
MGYVLRVRLASFFAGAATASFAGLYLLYKDFKVAHDAISQQVIIKISKKEKKEEKSVLFRLNFAVYMQPIWHCNERQ